MAKRRHIARVDHAVTAKRRRINISNPDPGGVKRTVKKPKKRFP